MLHGCEEARDEVMLETMEEPKQKEEGLVVEPVEGNLEISLNAMVGTPSTGTMRLVGQIDGEALVILVDLRSTHSFLDPLVPHKTKLKVDQSAKLVVRVANGDVVKSEGYYEAIPIKIQGNLFSSPRYILKLGGCDLVLRVNWLATLGPIVWDFSRLCMDFGK